MHLRAMGVRVEESKFATVHQVEVAFSRNAMTMRNSAVYPSIRVASVTTKTRCLQYIYNCAASNALAIPFHSQHSISTSSYVPPCPLRRALARKLRETWRTNRRRRRSRPSMLPPASNWLRPHSRTCFGECCLFLAGPAGEWSASPVAIDQSRRQGRMVPRRLTIIMGTWRSRNDKQSAYSQTTFHG